MRKVYITIGCALGILLSNCATHKAKYKSETDNLPSSYDTKEVVQTFYLIGDAGDAEYEESTKALRAFEKHIEGKNTYNAYTIFLGDNIYEKGLLAKSDKNYDVSKHRIDVQIDAVKGFDGKTLFIPGNHDWYDDGLKSLERQEKYIEKALGKNTFQPEDGCPIEKIDVTDDIVIIAIDSQWYLTNWDKHPTMNDECEIKTRNEFFLELEGELKKNNEKTIILAMHHPAVTYGPHGGGMSFQKHLFPSSKYIPLPVLGSLVAQIRTQGGVSPQDRYNSRYNELMQRLMTLGRGNDRLILVSGHEHNLQYNETNGVKQIVSGSGSKESATFLGEGAKFSYGQQGFAELLIYADGSSSVKFYSAENGNPALLYTTEVHAKSPGYDISGLPSSFNSTRTATVYDKSETEKSDRFKWFWGDHYRYVYGTDIKVPVATLDTLMGGFTIVRRGGGHQTRSLRLMDSNGRNFALRAVKKSAVQFLQTVAFKETYVEDDFRETLTEDAILDFYTSSHPFASFVVSDLADAVGVYHTNPFLFYMPKHGALGKYNNEYGDELYIIEERPDDGFLDVESFGKPDAIESTADVLKKLRRDEKYRMDEAAFIRARLFDMLLGDWDRHQDQWRWARFDISDDERVYRPIPRDRDQVFSNYDGFLLDVLKVLIPATKQFQEYDSDLKDIKWINSAGIKIDRTFLQTSTRQDWMDQAQHIVNSLTDDVIDNAFESLPLEVQDETANSIRLKLKGRRGNLADIAGRYYDYLSRLIIITGTDKDDLFELTRSDNKTVVEVSRIKDGIKQEPYKRRVINSGDTREVWIYGLDDDDKFVVKGRGDNPVFTRIIGGQNNDVYTIQNGRGIKVYDHKSKPNTFEQKSGAAFRLNDIYTNNTFDYTKFIDKTNMLVPALGFNPDDGMRIGFSDTYTIKGFKNNPFFRKHNVTAGYYFATQGFDLKYEGEFAQAFGQWNFLLGAHFTSENFARNFFGFGNDTENMDDDLDFDFNRVKTGILKGNIGVIRRGEYGSKVSITAGVERVEVDDTPGRFTTDLFMAMPEVFEKKTFGNVNFIYEYTSSNNPATPSRGMLFKLETGATTNLDDSERTFGYINPALEFYNSLTRNEKLVLRTKARGQFNIGDEFEFYQAAVLGANTGLRGFRTQRFSGESALAFGADLRYALAKFKTGLLPLKLSVFGGYDYGRVWIDGEDSDTWHDSVGGGLVINAVDALSGQFGIFSSDDGMRISFTFGLSL